jgi:putative DNA base modification enzyme with NMAD domain
VKGYVYITGDGADPGAGKFLGDPLFRGTPTLGACMPNIRRLVTTGDWIFVVSSKIPAFQQYVVGGLCVSEKISALAAHRRFPENRLQQMPNGEISGNVIVTAEGKQHPLDHHSPDSFGNRIKNFVVGSDAVALETEKEVALGRAQTLPKLADLIGKRGNRVFDVMSRWAKLDENQVQGMLNWLNGIKASAAGS